MGQVAIKEIESELERLWEAMPGAEKIKAALFTLIIYVEKEESLPYTETLLKHILGRYPCRVFFLQEAKADEVVASVSLETVGEGVSCDQIKITFPKKRQEEIPFILLPHLLPNVPVCMLWKGKPNPENPLYKLLNGTLDRLVVDPDNLDETRFTKALAEEPKCQVIDLKWASITGWRRILAKVIGQKGCLEEAKYPAKFDIQFAGGKGEPISASYLQAWLARQLGWEEMGTLTPIETSSFDYGTILSLTLETKKGTYFHLTLEPSGEFVRVNASSPTWCEIPYLAYLSPFRREEIFAKELFCEKAPLHYFQMLEHLSWQKTLLTA